VAPTLYDVLAGVRRGRVAYLCPTPEQKRLLRDRDGQVALDVLRHLLGARGERRDPERFPLTEGAFQVVAGKLGHRVGQKKPRRLIARLLQTGVVVAAGHYRQPYRDSGTRSGFRVALFALARRQRRGRFATSKRPVGKSSRHERKQRRRWWHHPLLGDIWGLPPPEIPGRDLRRMRSLDEVFSLHLYGIGKANAEGGWYARLKDSLGADITRLAGERSEGFFDYGRSRRWLLVGDLGMAALVAALAVAVIVRAY
jgi:hypothetical protein